MSGVFEIAGIVEFGLAIQRVVAQADAGTKRGVSKAASRVQRKAQENASGRPGPNVVSGSNRRGISVEPMRKVGIHAYETRVGPTMIYSRRLDLGFTGTDSLGRVYHQKAYPFFTPAWKDVVHDLPHIYAEEWTKAITG